MMPPVFKVVLLVLVSVFHHVAMKSPNPPPASDEKVYNRQPLDVVVRPLTAITRMLVTSYAMSECAVIVSYYYQTPYSTYILASLCPRPAPGISTISHLSPPFLLGVVLALSAAAIRIWCYKTLGRLFTFEVTIKKTHTLVTSGPYAYVRHPGYTAILLLFSGVALVFSGQGSYLNECQIMQTPARWVVGFWAASAVFVVVSLVTRGKNEDELLMATFGESWDRYRQAVPHKLVPGLF